MKQADEEGKGTDEEDPDADDGMHRVKRRKITLPEQCECMAGEGELCEVCKRECG